MWIWAQLRHKLGLGTAIPDKFGRRCFNWNPPCSLVDGFVFDKETLVCAVFTEHLDNSNRFSLFKGCNLVGQVSQQCIVFGQDLYCLYRNFKVIIGALILLVGRGGEGAPLPCSSRWLWTSSLRPFSHPSTLWLRELAIKFNRPTIKRRWPGIFLFFRVGGGMDWSPVSSCTAFLSKQVVKRSVNPWGNTYRLMIDHLSAD